MSFKALDQFWSPTGYWIALLPYGNGVFRVMVFDYATWKHRAAEFTSEGEARAYCDQWRL